MALYPVRNRIEVMKEVTDIFEKKGGVLLEQRIKFISLHALHLSMVMV